jgi:hypothetical protein
MTTGTHDEVALPHFEDHLWDELAELHDHRRQAPPPGAGADTRRRRVRRSVAAAVGAIAAATMLVVGLGVLPAGGPEPAEASLTERIMTATDDALASSVVHIVQVNVAVNDYESWYDRTSGAARDLTYDANGTPWTDGGRPIPPALDEQAPDLSTYPTEDHRIVDYCHHEYAHTRTPIARYTLGPQEIRDDLEAGRLVEDGTETIDGQELIRLRDVVNVDIAQFVLVDPSTYRPVQLYGDRGGPTEFVMTFEYLRRTNENLALLSPPLPDGFTEVPQIRPCN